MGDEPGALVFPSDSPFWDADFPGQWLVSKSKVIFVRQCYIDLYDLCRRAWDAGMQGVFLKGTPGVGKSFFLDYLMNNLMNDKKAVLLLSGPEYTAWLCSGFDRPAETCTLEKALTDRWAARADFVLLDPYENSQETLKLSPHIFCNKKFLIAMSPDPDNCKKIVKDARSVQYFYMGPTTMEESESMRLCCYNNEITSEQLQQRFDVGGGIPRFLFKTAATFSSGLNVDSVVNDIKEQQSFALNDLIKDPRRIDFGNVDSEFKDLWSLYHLVPDPKNFYAIYTIEICSANSRKLLLHRLLDKDILDLWDLFYTTNKKYGTLRGIRFEAYAHKKIMNGIDRTANLLTTNTISSNSTKRVYVPPGSTLFDLPDNNLDSLSRYTAAVNISSPMYLLPSLCNFPVIDSAYVGPENVRIMFQMNVGKSKLLTEKAETICQTLGNFFVVVVPADDVITRKLDGGPASMKQYVLVLKERTYW